MLEAAETQPPPRPEGGDEPPAATEAATPGSGYAPQTQVPLATQQQEPSEHQVAAEESDTEDGIEGSDGKKGFIGRQIQRLSENEKVQKASEWTQQKAKQIAEHEKVQKATEWTKDKAKQIAESEKVQKATEWSKDKAKQIAENEKVQQSVEFAKEKGKLIADKSKEAAQSLKAKAGGAWHAGKGSIKTVKEELGTMAWRGSAKDTLGIEAKKEQWQNIKVSGAEEITVPARAEHTCVYIVTKGSTLRWTFRVKERDLGFAVRMRIQEFGGSREEEVLPSERYDDSETVSGSWVADEDRQMVLVFDNKYSKLRAKTIAYIVGTERPPVPGADNFDTQEPAAASDEAVEGSASASPPAAS